MAPPDEQRNLTVAGMKVVSKEGSVVVDGVEFNYSMFRRVCLIVWSTACFEQLVVEWHG